MLASQVLIDTVLPGPAEIIGSRRGGAKQKKESFWASFLRRFSAGRPFWRGDFRIQAVVLIEPLAQINQAAAPTAERIPEALVSGVRGQLSSASPAFLPPAHFHSRCCRRQRGSRLGRPGLKQLCVGRSSRKYALLLFSSFVRPRSRRFFLLLRRAGRACPGFAAGAGLLFRLRLGLLLIAF